MQDDNIELMLWNNRFHAAQCILSQLVRIYGNGHFSKTFIGKHSGYYSIGDNDNVFSCNTIFVSIPNELVKTIEKTGEFDFYNGHVTRNMFTQIDKTDRNVVDAAIRQIFKNGNSLILMKSRWSASGNIILKDCYSMLDACQKIGIDAYKLLIELDLSTSI